MHANFINIAEQFALNAAFAKSIKYLVNHYLIFSVKKFIYDSYYYKLFCVLKILLAKAAFSTNELLINLKE